MHLKYSIHVDQFSKLTLHDNKQITIKNKSKILNHTKKITSTN